MAVCLQARESSTIVYLRGSGEINNDNQGKNMLVLIKYSYADGLGCMGAAILD